MHDGGTTHVGGTRHGRATADFGGGRITLSRGRCIGLGYGDRCCRCRVGVKTFGLTNFTRGRLANDLTTQHNHDFTAIDAIGHVVGDFDDGVLFDGAVLDQIVELGR